MIKDSLQSSYAFCGMAFALLFLVRFGLPWLFNYWQKQRLIKAGIADIDGMDGRTFEQYLEALFERLGYQVERTPYVGDYGADLVIRKDGIKTIVQAKRWKKSVGVRAIQEVVAAKAMYGCTEAMVVTNSNYTSQARELADANQVTLWDRQRLLDALLSVTRAGEPLTKTPSVSPAAANVPISTGRTSGLRSRHIPSDVRNDIGISQTCVLCNKPVSDDVAQYCLSRPKRFKGQIYCYAHQRTVAAKE